MSSVLQRSVEECLLSICEGVSTPRSLTVFLLVKNREWDQLVSLRVDPSHYDSADALKQDLIVSEFLRKCDDLPTSFDKEQVAIDNFWASEKQCFRTNMRLEPFLDHLDFGVEVDEEGSRIYDVIVQIRKKIASILGPLPDDLGEGRFGPGATYGDRGKASALPSKVANAAPTITPSAWPLLREWSETLWGRAVCGSDRYVDVQVVQGNRFTTVPKDSTKFRGIAVEPSINVFYQLAMGRLLRKRIRRAGIDLLTAQGVHMQVACEASKSGSHSSIDLSNASDTVSSALVRLLLPTKWFEVLNYLRSPFTLIQGKQVRLEKFSSMGNGFTFELETLIFIAISSVACDLSGCESRLGVDVHVFGDDILIPARASRVLLPLLRYLGFEPNPRKTFTEGNFRESCGGDYFKGMNVRPFYLKELPREPQDYIAIANGIRRLGPMDHSAGPCDARHLRAWFGIQDAIPTHVRRCRGPSTLGDIVIHDDESRWKTRWRNGIRYLQVYRPGRYSVLRLDRFDPMVSIAVLVYVQQLYRGGIIPRDGVRGYKLGWSAYS